MVPNPRVSIVIPVYNGANFLREAIDSALAQTYQNIEVIVVNDGSTDGGKTEEIVLSYGDRIRYFRKENGGVASALNVGIREMTGNFFSWLSHDDVYYPEKVAVNLENMLLYGKPCIVYSDYEQIDENGNRLKLCSFQDIQPSQLRISFILRRLIHGCSLLVPRECFDLVGTFNEHLLTTQDYDRWFRFAARYRFVHIPRILMKSRVHAQQGSRTIVSHRTERENFLISCMEDLTDQELQAYMFPSITWMSLALSLVGSGNSLAAHHALTKGLDEAGKEPLLVQLLVMILKAGYILSLNGRAVVRSLREMQKNFFFGNN